MRSRHHQLPRALADLRNLSGTAASFVPSPRVFYTYTYTCRVLFGITTQSRSTFFLSSAQYAPRKSLNLFSMSSFSSGSTALRTPMSAFETASVAPIIGRRTATGTARITERT